MSEVMRYVESSRRGSGPLLSVPADLDKRITSKEAAMPVEYGVKGSELMAVLRKGCEKFIRAMELRGMTLIPIATGNPVCVTHKDGRPYGTYSMTKDFERSAPDELLDAKGEGGKGPTTLKQPQSLEDSGGFVDYRFVGVFWTPVQSMEIAVERSRRLEQEKKNRNPRQWGAGSATPTRPSIAS